MQPPPQGPQWQPPYGPPQYPQYQQPQYPQWQQSPQGYPQPPYPPQMPKRKRRTWLWIVIAAIIVIVIASAGGNHGNSQSSTTTTTSNASTTTSATPPQATTQVISHPTPTPTPRLAYELAAIDAGGYLPDSDPSIAKYQALLDSLHNKTGDSEQMIADETVRGQQLLHDKGRDVKLLVLLEAVDTAIKSKSEHIHYAEALAALITLMTSNN